ncbi:hypothetical protein ExPUPEC79_01332 [Escherichia coli]|nr:hypothetical protein ExPUPEC79_01332 [Escherichia coli]
MLANQTKTFLVLGRRRIFHPEQAVILNAPPKARRFDGGQAMVHVMQQMFVKTELITHRFK